MTKLTWSDLQMFICTMMCVLTVSVVNTVRCSAESVLRHERFAVLFEVIHQTLVKPIPRGDIIMMVRLLQLANTHKFQSDK